MTRIRLCYRAIAVIALITVLIVASTRLRADTGTCGGESVTLPFTDVPSSNVFFCSIAAAYFSGISNGTSADTFSPSVNVPREQMTAFVSRTLYQSLKRGGRRAALKQFWNPKSADDVPKTTVGTAPVAVESDGADLWVANAGGTVSRVRASDGRVLETWTGANLASSVLVARGHIYVTGNTINGGGLYSITPTLPAGPVSVLKDDLFGSPSAMAFDGNSIWIAHIGSRVTRVTFGFPCLPICVTTYLTGFTQLRGIIYDGSNIWVTDYADDSLKKLDSTGSVIFALHIGSNPSHPVFDGTNLWVPLNANNHVAVVRVKDNAGNPLASPFLLAMLTGNGLNKPYAAAFDGERILVTNEDGDSVSLWKAMDLTPLGSVSFQSFGGGSVRPLGACSDGLNFWVALFDTDRLARF